MTMCLYLCPSPAWGTNVPAHVAGRTTGRLHHVCHLMQRCYQKYNITFTRLSLILNKTLPKYFTFYSDCHLTPYVSQCSLPFQWPYICALFFCRYLLYAIITHAGVTLTSGHYLSYVHVPQTTGSGSPRHFLSTPTQQFPGHWLECDDETVRVHDEPSFHSMLQGEDGSLMGTPYVLFYHRNTPVSKWSAR